MPRSEPPAAAKVAEVLEFMSLRDAAALVGRNADSAWLERCVGARVLPVDEGVFWLALPGDVEIWPVRVLVYAWDGERHAVWLTYQWPDGSDLVVQTQEGPPVLQVYQQGEAGRLQMLAGGDSGTAASP